MSSAGTRPTILVVDDEPALRDMLTSVLKLEGYSVEVAPDGQDAINIMQNAPTTRRVILLDLLMQNVNGAGVVRWLVEHPDIRANSRIILMSANNNLKAAFDLTHDGELSKPFGVDAMLETIGKFSQHS
jgi:CheY-like chemotaxis protein